MVTINDKKFHEVPCMCGACPFFLGNGKKEGGRQSQTDFCVLFSKRKNFYGTLPKRCATLFGKAMAFPDGETLVVVAKE